jgi:hypothetical protein
MTDYLVGFSNSMVRFANFVLPHPTPEDATVMELPNVVSPADWRAALDDIRAKEKAETHRRDALAAGRRPRHDEHPLEVVR